MVSAAGIIGHSIDVEVEKELLATDTSTSDESTNKEGGEDSELSDGDVTLDELGKRHCGKGCIDSHKRLRKGNVGVDDDLSNNGLDKVMRPEEDVVPRKRVKKEVDELTHKEKVRRDWKRILSGNQNNTRKFRCRKR